MFRSLVFLLAAGVVVGQDAGLARLKQEMAAAREQSEHAEKNGAARIVAVHDALRVWIEARLPPNIHSLAGQFSRLETSLSKMLASAGVFKSDPADPDRYFSDPGFDEVRVELKMMPEFPDMLFVIAGLKVPCGEDQAVYAYRFDSNGWARVIDDHPASDWGYGSAALESSDPDYQGRRLLLIHRDSVQCSSNWMGMTYAVYRLSPSRQPELALSSEHSFWLDDGPLLVLKANELIIEFIDSGFETERRTNIFRYDFTGSVKRVEPFALEPGDFAEEWLARPWSEMRSLAAAETQKWHGKLHADFLLGEYIQDVACIAKPDRWAIGFKIAHVGEKELKEPIDAYFLVRDLGNYRFEMEAVSDHGFDGCPGEGTASDKHPWLSVEQLKALP